MIVQFAIDIVLDWTCRFYSVKAQGGIGACACVLQLRPTTSSSPAPVDSISSSSLLFISRNGALSLLLDLKTFHPSTCFSNGQIPFTVQPFYHCAILSSASSKRKIKAVLSMLKLFRDIRELAAINISIKEPK
ncbi:Anthranilate phosphoribosyltransferase,chloroplastic [Trichinella pseudospiralis]